VIDLFFLFLLSLVLDLHYDVPLYLHLFHLITMTSCTLFWYGGRRREWDLFFFAAVLWTKAKERIRKIPKWYVLITLCHRLLVDKSLWR
jgi:hypothetical protein